MEEATKKRPVEEGTRDPTAVEKTAVQKTFQEEAPKSRQDGTAESGALQENLSEQRSVPEVTCSKSVEASNTHRSCEDGAATRSGHLVKEAGLQAVSQPSGGGPGAEEG